MTIDAGVQAVSASIPTAGQGLNNGNSGASGNLVFAEALAQFAGQSGHKAVNRSNTEAALLQFSGQEHNQHDGESSQASGVLHSALADSESLELSQNSASAGGGDVELLVDGESLVVQAQEVFDAAERSAAQQFEFLFGPVPVVLEQVPAVGVVMNEGLPGTRAGGVMGESSGVLGEASRGSGSLHGLEIGASGGQEATQLHVSNHTSSVSAGLALNGVNATSPSAPTLPAQPSAPVMQPVVDQNDVARQIRTPLLKLAATPAGEQTITIRLTPETLGTVEVKATVTESGTRISVVPQNDNTREMLRVIVSDIRRDLTVVAPATSVSVSDSTLSGNQGNQGFAGESNSRSHGREQSPEQSAASAQQGSVSSLSDDATEHKKAQEGSTLDTFA